MDSNIMDFKYNLLTQQLNQKYIKHLYLQYTIRILLNLVSQCNSDNIKKITLTRGARTDKGVHALCNTLSVKLQITQQYCESFSGNKTKDKPNIDKNIIISEINNQLPSDIMVHGFNLVTKSFNVKSQAESRIYSYIAPLFCSNLLQLQEICQIYQGTHNFHNYTSKKSFNDPSSNRYYKLFKVNKITNNGEEFLKFTIHGNSFMYHQIRKTIGTIYQIIKEDKPLSYIQYTFQEEKLNLYVAPQTGLYLEQICFDGYNQKHDIPEKIEIQQEQKLKIEKFEENLINTICNEYQQQNIFEEWYKDILIHK